MTLRGCLEANAFARCTDVSKWDGALTGVMLLIVLPESPDRKRALEPVKH